MAWASSAVAARRRPARSSSAGRPRRGAAPRNTAQQHQSQAIAGPFGARRRSRARPARCGRPAVSRVHATRASNTTSALPHRASQSGAQAFDERCDPPVPATRPTAAAAPSSAMSQASSAAWHSPRLRQRQRAAVRRARPAGRTGRQPDPTPPQGCGACVALGAAAPRGGRGAHAGRGRPRLVGVRGRWQRRAGSLSFCNRRGAAALGSRRMGGEPAPPDGEPTTDSSVPATHRCAGWPARATRPRPAQAGDLRKHAADAVERARVLHGRGVGAELALPRHRRLRCARPATRRSRDDEDSADERARRAGGQTSRRAPAHGRSRAQLRKPQTGRRRVCSRVVAAGEWPIRGRRGPCSSARVRRSSAPWSPRSPRRRRSSRRRTR